MPKQNYTTIITKQVTDSYDLTWVSKQSITKKLKQQNKNSSAATKKALASLLKSKTIILDNKRYRLPWQNRSTEWREEARIHKRIGEMTASKLRARAKMLGLTPDDIPNKELKAAVISTQIQMTAAGAFLSLMVAIKLGT